MPLSAQVSPFHLLIFDQHFRLALQDNAPRLKDVPLLRQGQGKAGVLLC